MPAVFFTAGILDVAERDSFLTIIRSAIHTDPADPSRCTESGSSL